MSLDSTLQMTMGVLPECVASGYIDLESGLLLGVHTVDPHPQEVLDTLVTATVDLFQGSNVVAMGKMFQAPGDSPKGCFNEVIMFSDDHIHVFLRTRKHPEHVICFVCRKSANPGMVLTRARLAIDTVSQAVWGRPGSGSCRLAEPSFVGVKETFRHQNVVPTDIAKPGFPTKRH
ncbi:MAG: hypothetical protein WBB85_14550 [Albidovulum sp.]|uniref:hypothetical protein n=1 Tax=Albidovulum sp. TaxID=1872424 RepID=UPI003CA26FEC